MTEVDRLAGALGASDPESWARSEADEAVPQLARYRLLRAVSGDIAHWEPRSRDWVDAYQRDSRTAEAISNARVCGVSDDDFGVIAREVARETAFGLLYRLSD